MTKTTLHLGAILGLMMLCSSSCYTYKVFPKEYRTFQYTGEKKEAFILNTSLKKESSILIKSGIYNFVDDSSKPGVVKIKLYPVNKAFVCGNGIIVSAVTLGQLPTTLPDRYLFRYDEIDNEIVNTREYELKVATQYWFWAMFVFNKRFEDKAGKALSGAHYLEKRQVSSALF